MTEERIEEVFVFWCSETVLAQVEDYEICIRQYTDVNVQQTERISPVFRRITWLRITIVFLRVV